MDKMLKVYVKVFKVMGKASYPVQGQVLLFVVLPSPEKYLLREHRIRTRLSSP